MGIRGFSIAQLPVTLEDIDAVWDQPGIEDTPTPEDSSSDSGTIPAFIPEVGMTESQRSCTGVSISQPSGTRHNVPPEPSSFSITGTEATWSGPTSPSLLSERNDVVEGGEKMTSRGIHKSSMEAEVDAAPSSPQGEKSIDHYSEGSIGEENASEEKLEDSWVNDKTPTVWKNSMNTNATSEVATQEQHRISDDDPTMAVSAYVKERGEDEGQDMQEGGGSSENEGEIRKGNNSEGEDLAGVMPARTMDGKTSSDATPKRQQHVSGNGSSLRNLLREDGKGGDEGEIDIREEEQNHGDDDTEDKTDEDSNQKGNVLEEIPNGQRVLEVMVEQQQHLVSEHVLIKNVISKDGEQDENKGEQGMGGKWVCGKEGGEKEEEGKHEEREVATEGFERKKRVLEATSRQEGYIFEDEPISASREQNAEECRAAKKEGEGQNGNDGDMPREDKDNILERKEEDILDAGQEGNMVGERRSPRGKNGREDATDTGQEATFYEKGGPEAMDATPREKVNAGKRFPINFDIESSGLEGLVEGQLTSPTIATGQLTEQEDPPKKRHINCSDLDEKNGKVQRSTCLGNTTRHGPTREENTPEDDTLSGVDGIKTTPESVPEEIPSETETGRQRVRSDLDPKYDVTATFARQHARGSNEAPITEGNVESSIEHEKRECEHLETEDQVITPPGDNDGAHNESQVFSLPTLLTAANRTQSQMAVMSATVIKDTDEKCLSSRRTLSAEAFEDQEGKGEKYEHATHVADDGVSSKKEGIGSTTLVKQDRSSEGASKIIAAKANTCTDAASGTPSAWVFPPSFNGLVVLSTARGEVKCSFEGQITLEQQPRIAQVEEKEPQTVTHGENKAEGDVAIRTCSSTGANSPDGRMPWRSLYCTYTIAENGNIPPVDFDLEDEEAQARLESLLLREYNLTMDEVLGCFLPETDLGSSDAIVQSFANSICHLRPSVMSKRQPDGEGSGGRRNDVVREAVGAALRRQPDWDEVHVRVVASRVLKVSTLVTAVGRNKGGEEDGQLKARPTSMSSVISSVDCSPVTLPSNLKSHLVAAQLPVSAVDILERASFFAEAVIDVSGVLAALAEEARDKASPFPSSIETASRIGKILPTMCPSQAPKALPIIPGTRDGGTSEYTVAVTGTSENIHVEIHQVSGIADDCSLATNGTGFPHAHVSGLRAHDSDSLRFPSYFTTSSTAPAPGEISRTPHAQGVATGWPKNDDSKGRASTSRHSSIGIVRVQSPSDKNEQDGSSIESDENGVVKPGVRVEARFGGRSAWFPGVVRAIHPRGVAGNGVSGLPTVEVEYDDGDREDNAPRVRVRLEGQKQPRFLNEGDEVDFKKGKKIALARVVRLSSSKEGHYDLRLLDGKGNIIVENVHRSAMMALHGWPPPKDGELPPCTSK